MQMLNRLVSVTVFCLIFMAVEVAGGLYARSLAILTDAAHLMSDVASFLIALAALWAASLRSNDHHSYGYHRAEIIGALLSVVMVWIVTAGLVVQAVRRLIQPHPVNGFLMFVIACCGVLVNVVMAFILHGCGRSDVPDMGHFHGHSHGSSAIHARQEHGYESSPHTPCPEEGLHTSQDSLMGSSTGHGHSHKGQEHGALASESSVGIRQVDPTATALFLGGNPEPDSLTQSLLNSSHAHTHGTSSGTPTQDQNINVRGAAVHVLGDLVQSIGVAVAGALIWWKPQWVILDPICTFLFSILVVLTTKNITRDIFDVLMERVPRDIDVKELGEDILSVPGVKSVHDLHVWSLTLGRPLMSTHVDLEAEADPNLVLDAVQHVCQSKWGLNHTTIQIDNHSV